MQSISAIWHNVIGWLGENAWPIIIILVLGWLGRHFGGILISQIVRHLVRQTRFNELSKEDVKKRQDTLISLFVAIWRVLVVVVTCLVLFGQIFPHISLAPLFASAGIVGIALGFGAQSVIRDLLSGVFIILENQYRVGDVVDIEGASGSVEQITIHSTILRDGDGNVHYIPNGSIAHVINKTMGFSRVNFAVSVAPETNIDELSELINGIGTKMAEEDKWRENMLEPPHFLTIGSFTNTALEVKIGGKTQPSKQWDVTGEYRRRLLSAFKKHHITLAPLNGALPPAATGGKKK